MDHKAFQKGDRVRLAMPLTHDGQTIPAGTGGEIRVVMLPRGYFGIGVFHSKSECNIGTLLRSAQAFGAAFVFTVGKRYTRQSSDTGKAYKHIPTFHFSGVKDLKAHLPMGCPLIGIELVDTARSLPRFVHPERACYLLGAEDHGLSDEALFECHSLVQIPGPSRCLNVAVAGSIVLYDRAVKEPAHG